jgi:hypothetical protein
VQCFHRVNIDFLSSPRQNLVTVEILVQEVAVFRSPRLRNWSNCGMEVAAWVRPGSPKFGFVMGRQRRSYLLIEPEPRREHASKQLVRPAVSFHSYFRHVAAGIDCNRGEYVAIKPLRSKEGDVLRQEASLLLSFLRFP